MPRINDKDLINRYLKHGLKGTAIRVYCRDGKKCSREEAKKEYEHIDNGSYDYMLANVVIDIDYIDFIELRKAYDKRYRNKVEQLTYKQYSKVKDYGYDLKQENIKKLEEYLKQQGYNENEWSLVYGTYFNIDPDDAPLDYKACNNFAKEQGIHFNKENGEVVNYHYSQAEYDYWASQECGLD